MPSLPCICEWEWPWTVESRVSALSLPARQLAPKSGLATFLLPFPVLSLLCGLRILNVKSFGFLMQGMESQTLSSSLEWGKVLVLWTLASPLLWIRRKVTLAQSPLFWGCPWPSWMEPEQWASLAWLEPAIEARWTQEPVLLWRSTLLPQRDCFFLFSLVAS